MSGPDQPPAGSVLEDVSAAALAGFAGLPLLVMTWTLPAGLVGSMTGAVGMVFVGRCAERWLRARSTK